MNTLEREMKVTVTTDPNIKFKTKNSLKKCKKKIFPNQGKAKIWGQISRRLLKLFLKFWIILAILGPLPVAQIFY